MSEEDSSRQASSHEQTQRERERPQGERGGGGSGAGSSSSGGGGGRHGRRRHAPQTQPSQLRRPEASFNLKELRELVELFNANGLTDFEFENEDIRIRLSRNVSGQPNVSGGGSQAQMTYTPGLATTPANSTRSGSSGSTTGASTASTPAAGEASRGEAADTELQIIPSPIVGTFYRSPSPAADPFVRPGSHVEPDTTVCIIEAMKLMNEIQAETTGTVEKIYVENGQPVEYGQPLFGVRK